MPFVNASPTTTDAVSNIFAGPGCSLGDGFQFQAGPTSTNAADYSKGTVFTGPIVAATYSDPLAIVTRPHRTNKITVSIALGGTPAPTAVSASLLGSVDGVNYSITLANFNVAQDTIIPAIDVSGINFVKFEVTTLDQGTLLPLISEG